MPELHGKSRQLPVCETKICFQAPRLYVLRQSVPLYQQIRKSPESPAASDQCFRTLLQPLTIFLIWGQEQERLLYSVQWSQKESSQHTLAGV